MTALLTDDVHWGGEHGDECIDRVQVGERYAGLIAAGFTVHLTDICSGRGTLIATLRIEGPDPEDNRRRAVTVRLTLREGLIADIRELDPPPTIELLYFDDCPNHEIFRPHLRQLPHEHDINTPVTLLRIDNDDDAQTHRFLGSPTLRINGLDVEPATLAGESYALQWRRYATPMA